MITLEVDTQLTYRDACAALGALRQEIRAALCVCNEHQLPHHHEHVIRERCRKLQDLIPIAEALVDALQPQPLLFWLPATGPQRTHRSARKGA